MRAEDGFAGKALMSLEFLSGLADLPSPIPGLPEGVRYYPGLIGRRRQEVLRVAVAEAVKTAPFYIPRMPRSGKSMSVQMTNMGPLGWLTDKEKGYRYEPRHPVTGAPWPPMPPLLLEMWDWLTAWPAPPEACLVNYYGPHAKMGAHQDRDEEAIDAPVLSVSLGDSARFRLGGLKRSDPSRHLLLHSGDVLILEGPSRMRFHGIERVLGGSSGLLPEGGRINLTLRRVTLA